MNNKYDIIKRFVLIGFALMSFFVHSSFCYAQDVYDQNKNKNAAVLKMYESVLSKSLKKIVDRQVAEDKLLIQINGRNIGTVYSIESIIKLLLQNEASFDQASRQTGVPKEMICAVIFREMLCLSIDDLLFDNIKPNGTIGIAQISIEGAMNNEILLNGDNSCPYNEKELKKMLNSYEKSIYLAARQLHVRIMSIGRPLSEMKQSDKEKAFGRYNGNVSIVLFGKIHYSQGAEKYGKQTYEYYQVFKDFFKKKPLKL